jgi:molybdate transport system substrate-binding protein
MRSLYLVRWIIVLTVLLYAGVVRAEEARVAVATNFLPPLKEIAARFRAETGHDVTISSGSTGKLYAQILNGAPFDLFFSADTVQTGLLEAKGFAVPGSRFVYAVGRLVLWSADPDLIKVDGAATLREKKFKHLAMANPKTAPYGQAALQVMQSLGVWGGLSSTVVMGEDIGQAFQFVASKNAELGFVALSQSMVYGNAGSSRWEVPASLYNPIRQEAVLLKHGESNTSALALAKFLRTAKVGEIIERYGYGLK